MVELGDQILLCITLASATYSRVFLYPKTFYCIGFTCLAAGLLERNPSTWVRAVRFAAAASPFIPPGLPRKVHVVCELIAVSLGLTVAIIPIIEHTTDAAWATTAFFVAGCGIDALNRFALRVV